MGVYPPRRSIYQLRSLVLEGGDYGLQKSLYEPTPQGGFFYSERPPLILKFEINVHRVHPGAPGAPYSDSKLYGGFKYVSFVPLRSRGAEIQALKDTPPFAAPATLPPAVRRPGGRTTKKFHIFSFPARDYPYTKN